MPFNVSLHFRFFSNLSLLNFSINSKNRENLCHKNKQQQKNRKKEKSDSNNHASLYFLSSISTTTNYDYNNNNKHHTFRPTLMFVYVVHSKCNCVIAICLKFDCNPFDMGILSDSLRAQVAKQKRNKCTPN